MKRNIINFSLFFVLSLAITPISAIAQAVSSQNTERITLNPTPVAYISETMPVTQEATNNDLVAALLLLTILGLLTKVNFQSTVIKNDQVNNRQNANVKIQANGQRRDP